MSLYRLLHPWRYKSRKQRILENVCLYVFSFLIFIGLVAYSYFSKDEEKSEPVPSIETAISTTVDESVVSEGVVDSTAETRVSVSSLSSSCDENLAYESLIEFCRSINISGRYSAIPVNGNVPSFTEDEISATSYEQYNNLDGLGRATSCIACLSADLMPTEDRAERVEIEPSGWHSIPAENVELGWLYNRCHLIAYCLTGENDTYENFITGTRNLNESCMLPFEIEVAEVLDDNPDLHIMYRITPIYENDDLVCNGVLMEALSVEDNGQAISFCVFCPNTQPSWTIDYSTGYATSDVYEEAA